VIDWLVGIPIGFAIGWVLRTSRRPKTAMLCRISDGPEMGKFVAVCKDGHVIELEQEK